MTPKMQPRTEASPFAGAENSTIATPPRANTAKNNARVFSRSPKNFAPIGTTMNGVIALIISTLATLLLVAPR